MKAMNTGDQTRAAEPYYFKTGSITSKDGTKLNYRQLGHGPGVVILHGTMESAQSHMQLALALSDAFTLYLPDRRSLSLGFPFVQDYSIQKEIEDLEALCLITDTHNIFGVSSGAIICLQASLTLSFIRKAVAYEPPLSFTRSYANAVLTRFDKEMSQGKSAAAMITAMKGSQMGPPIMKFIPRWILEKMTARMMKQGEKQENSDNMKNLAPALHYDFQLVAETSENLERFKTVRAEVSLLGGSRSPAYLRNALDALEKILPHVRRLEFPGLDHGGSSDPSNFNKGGNPALVAQEMRKFFANP